MAAIITYPFQYRGSVSQASDANNLTSSGWYIGSSGVANLEDWFHLIVFNFGSGYIFQIAKHNSNNAISIRTRNESGVWSAWNYLSLS